MDAQTPLETRVTALESRVDAIFSRLADLNLVTSSATPRKPKRLFTPAEIQTLRDLSRQGVTVREIAVRLDRTSANVYPKMKSLGLPTRRSWQHRNPTLPAKPVIAAPATPVPHVDVWDVLANVWEDRLTVRNQAFLLDKKPITRAHLGVRTNEELRDKGKAPFHFSESWIDGAAG